MKEKTKKTACAEYITYMEAYRVYMESTPETSIAYDDDLEEIKEWADSHNYKLKITA